VIKVFFTQRRSGATKVVFAVRCAVAPLREKSIHFGK
jgi:hypothetical protein